MERMTRLEPFTPLVPHRCPRTPPRLNDRRRGLLADLSSPSVPPRCPRSVTNPKEAADRPRLFKTVKRCRRRPTLGQAHRGRRGGRLLISRKAMDEWFASLEDA